jgi:hypothetical protein
MHLRLSRSGRSDAGATTRTIGSRGATYSYQETEEYKLKPWQLRQMPIYRAVLVHAGRPGQFKKVSLKMLTGSEININTRKEQTL